jgi:hypothetical protein
MASAASFDVEEARSLEVGLVYSLLNVGKLGCMLLLLAVHWPLKQSNVFGLSHTTGQIEKKEEDVDAVKAFMYAFCSSRSLVEAVSVRGSGADNTVVPFVILPAHNVIKKAFAEGDHFNMRIQIYQAPINSSRHNSYPAPGLFRNISTLVFGHLLP